MSSGKRAKPTPIKTNPLLIAGGFLVSVLSLGTYQMVSAKATAPQEPKPHDTTASTPVITPSTPRPKSLPSATAKPTPKVTPTSKPSSKSTGRVYRLPVTAVTPQHRRPEPTPTVAVTPTPEPEPVVVPVVSGAAPVAELLEFLHAQVGKPYVFGATGPGAFDCSGLIQAAFARVGVQLPRTSESQSALGYGVPLSAARPGDILYWGTPGSAGHTAIYLGAGHYLAAENSHLGVVVLPMTWDPPSGARRIKI